MNGRIKNIEKNMIKKKEFTIIYYEICKRNTELNFLKNKYIPGVKKEIPKEGIK